jgi:hypothetical protein
MFVIVSSGWRSGLPLRFRLSTLTASAAEVPRPAQTSARRGIAREHDDGLNGATQTVLRLVRQDIGRCSRGVAIYNKPAANEELGEWGCEEDEQVQTPAILALRRATLLPFVPSSQILSSKIPMAPQR